MADKAKINISSLKQNYMVEKPKNIEVEEIEIDPGIEDNNKEAISSNVDSKPLGLKLKRSGNQNAVIDDDELSRDKWLDGLEKDKKSENSSDKTEKKEEEDKELFVNYESSFTNEKSEEASSEENKELNKDDKKLSKKDDNKKKSFLDKLNKKQKIFIGFSSGLIISILAIGLTINFINGIPSEQIETNVGKSEIDKIKEEVFIEEELWIGAAKFNIAKSGTGKYKYEEIIYSSLEDLMITINQDIKKHTNEKIINSVKK